MTWFSSMITRGSQERTKYVYRYRVRIEEGQRVRSKKLPLGV